MARTLPTSSNRPPCTADQTARSGLRALAGAGMLALFALLLPGRGDAATAPGTVIANVARATFTPPGGGSGSVDSNLHQLVVQPSRTPSDLAFLRYDPTATVNLPVGITDYSPGGSASGPFFPLPAPAPAPGAPPLDLPAPLPLVDTAFFHSTDPVFLRLSDGDQNLDAAEVDTVLVTVTSCTGDRELLRLYETGPDTGVFTGYLQATTAASAPGDGLLGAREDCTFEATYRDAVDNNDSSAAAALVDPLGVVFDSVSGAPVTGARVELLRADGQPATVYGDGGPGCSFPNRIVTGEAVTDSCGQTYIFPAGAYRFPLLEAGSYRLQVSTPTGYVAPSTVTDAALQALPGAPYALGPGSRGSDFVVPVGPAFRLDIPLDPDGERGLWLEKRAGKEVVGIGDFLPYELRLSNATPLPAAQVALHDRLPPGFRYQRGSARLDGGPLADPAISADGQELTFALGDLAPAQSLILAYVVEVAAGSRPGDAAVNTAVAATASASSNTARASVRVREELVRSRSFIVGRVMLGDCALEDSAKTGVQGVRIFLEDGTFAVTDEQGMYHFEGIQPGVHVVQLDPETIPPSCEPLECDPSPRFAGTATSQFVDLQGGTLWRADFHLALRPPTEGELQLGLESRLQEGSLAVSVQLSGSGVPVDNARLSLLLPPGATYVAGSSRLQGEALADPDLGAGVLTYRLGARPAEWRQTLTLALEVPLAGEVAELPLKALLTVDTPTRKNLRSAPVNNSVVRSRDERRVRLPEIVVRPSFPTLVAELSAADRAELLALAERLQGLHIVELEAVGHTDNVRIAPEHRHLFTDNDALSLARARSVAAFLAEALRLDPAGIAVRGVADRFPVAGNDSAQGRAFNRRVELRLVAEREEVSHALQPLQTSDRAVPLPTIGLRPGESLPAPPPAAPTASGAARFDDEWLQRAAPGTEWLWPPEHHSPPIPSLKIVVKHSPAERPELWLNGLPASPLNFEESRKNAAGTVAVSSWSGVDIAAGDNLCVLRLFATDGTLLQELRRTTHYSGPPVRAELVAEQSQPVADGRSEPVVVVRLLDRDGFPAREGVTGTFRVEPPYAAADDHFPQGRPEKTGLSAQARYQIGTGGIVEVRLKPNARSGEARLVFDLADGEETVQAWLRPALRDWVLVGLGEGSLGYNTVTGHLEPLGSDDIEEDFYSDGRLAFFAKGKIKGSWLLTLAFDSDKKKEKSLFQTIDPDRYYPLYGDGSEQQYEASSASKLYIKLERDEFYALFGDFDTGLTVTELSRYSRSLNGFKSELSGGRFSYSIFAADTGQRFVKDELRGDGTSGLYRLSHAELVLNSEKIVIETRDRFHSELILGSRPLVRHLDYEIDYDDGTLWFKEPVPSRDGAFNPIYIVADYETDDDSEESLNFGGRAAARFLGGTLELGASYIHEDEGAVEGDLLGTDATLKFGSGTTIKAEVAGSDTRDGADDHRARAWLSELRHRDRTLDGRLYYREEESGFGLGQQRASEEGIRKFGAEGNYRLSERLTLGGEAARQTNLETDAEGDLFEANLTYRETRYSLSTGLRHAVDRLADGERNRSDQALVGATWQPNLRTTLRASHEQSLGGRDASADYPTRTLFGADYRLSERVTLFGEQELTWGAAEDTQGTRAGLKAVPWQGAQATSSVERSTTENGDRVFANLGLYQRWQVTRNLTLDGGLDRSQTLRHPGNEPINPVAAPASGEREDFTALSFGVNWQEEAWSCYNRLEYRTSDSEDKYGIAAGIMGEVRRGLGLSARLRLLLTDASGAGEGTNGELKLGSAWRPTDSRWIVLERLDYLFERQTGTGNGYDNWRLVNSTHANWKANRRTQLALQYGAKYVNERIDGESYAGFTDLVGIEARHDLSARWEVGLRGSLLHAWHAGQFDYSAGASVGYRVVKNAWFSLGYNFVGFEDEDFSRADYTAQGPFLRFRFKFDQDSVKELLRQI